jgi:outer membrane receptor protein involved in Fe transport
MLTGPGVFVLLATGLWANEPALREREAPLSKWSTEIAAGYLHQFGAGFEETSGSFDVNRFISRVSLSYRPNEASSLSLSMGYDRHAYEFSGINGLSGLDPWNGVHTFRIGTPVRWRVHESWTLFVIPAVRWAAADGADWAQALSGGGFVGAAWRINDRLTVGPGFGALTQLEDSPSYFPVLIINWDITEHIKLETGRGLGASLGPGLQLSYALDERWRMALGGRYERFRFRLNSDAPSPDGIGQDRAMSVYLGTRYSWSKKGSVSVLAGVNFGGQLRLDDSDGNEVASSDYEAAPFVGMSLDLRL